MKKTCNYFILCLCGMILLFYGCSKSSPSAPAEPETSMKFKVNGTLYEWKHRGWCGIYCGIGITKWPTYHKLSSIDPGNVSNTLTCDIATATFSATSYNSVVAVPVSPPDALQKLGLYNGGSFFFAASTETGDYFNITITSLHDGKYADGVFTARLTQAPYGSGAPKADITEGEFRNVVIYQ